MRNVALFILLFCACLLGTLRAFPQQSPPCTLDIPSADSFAQWTVIDGDGDAAIYGDDYKWKYNSSDAYCKQKSSYPTDDWLISPAITLQGGHSYRITAYVKASSRWDDNSFQICAGSQATSEGMKVLHSETGFKATSYTPYECVFSPDADGSYHIAVHYNMSTSSANQLYFQKFEVEEIIAHPGAVDNLTAVANDEGNAVTLTWTWPTVADTGAPFTQTITGARIYRGTTSGFAVDETSLVATLSDGYTPGTDGTWTDSDIPSPGIYYYKVVPYIEAGASEIAPVAASATVNPPATIPYLEDFSNADTHFFTFVNEGTGRNWSRSSSSGNGYLDYWGSGTDVQAWAISPRIKLEAGKAYKIKFNSWISRANNDKDLKVALGDQAAPASLTKVLADQKVTSANSSTEYSAIFTVAASGTYYVGFECYGNISGSYDIYVDNVSIEETAIHPGAVTDLTAVANETTPCSVTLSWNWPSVSDSGDDYTQQITGARIYRGTTAGFATSDETLAATINEGYTPGSSCNWTDPEITATATYYYKVVPFSASGASEAEPLEVSVFVNPPATIPYFEDFSSADTHFFTFVNGGTDGKNWTRNSGGYLDYWGSGTDVQAWAVSPRIKLEAGKAYKLTFNSYVSKANNDKNLRVALGQEASPSAMTKVLMEESVSTTNKDNAYESVFSVDASGNYNLGFECYGEIIGYEDIIVDNLSIEEIEVSPQPVSQLTATAGELGALNATLTWTNPTLSNAGTPVSEDMITKYEIFRNTELLQTVQNATTSFFDETITEAGNYTYKVVVYIGDNASTSSDEATVYVGVDTPAAPENVSLTKNSDGTATLTFDPVTTGINGGYVNAADIEYEVYLEDCETSAKQFTQTTGEPSYTFAKPEAQLSLYRGCAVALLGEKRSAASVSAEQIALGDALSLPWLQTLDQKASDGNAPTGLWTIETNTEGKSWEWSEKDCLNTSYANTYTFTPPFTAEKGKVKLTVETSCFSALFEPESLKIGLFNEAASTATPAVTKVLPVKFSSFYMTSELEYDIPDDGVYHLGFWLDEVTMQCKLKSVKIEQTEVTPDPLAPAVISDLTVTPADNGALEAVATWTNPAVDVNNVTLEKLLKVEVYLDDAIFTTYDDATPSEKISCPITVAEPGVHKVKVLTYTTEELVSDPAEVETAWIGHDTPKAPENVLLTVNENGSATLTFTPVTEGINGGYINLDNLVYRITRIGETEHQDINNAQLDIPAPAEIAPYCYEVMAVDNTYCSTSVRSNTVVIGDAVTLPYDADFTDADDMIRWTEAEGWTYNPDAMCMESATGNATLHTPPFYSEQGAIELSYSAKCGAGDQAYTLQTTLIDAATKAIVGKPDEKLITSTTAEAHEAKFEVPSHGKYQICFTIPDGSKGYLCATSVKYVASGIDSIFATGGSMFYDASNAVLHVNGRLLIYNITGICVLDTQADGAVSLSMLEPGIYIVTANGMTIKIEK